MTYLTRANLEARFGETLIADLEAGGAVVADAIADAAAEVDTYLAARYALPLASVPSVIVRLAAAIARYNLWRRDVAKEHPAYMAYSDALKALQAIASGAMLLGVDAANEEPVAEGGAQIRANERVFTGGADGSLADY